MNFRAETRELAWSSCLDPGPRLRPYPTLPVTPDVNRNTNRISRPHSRPLRVPGRPHLGHVPLGRLPPAVHGPDTTGRCTPITDDRARHTVTLCPGSTTVESLLGLVLSVPYRPVRSWEKRTEVETEDDGSGPRRPSVNEAFSLLCLPSQLSGPTPLPIFAEDPSTCPLLEGRTSSSS